MTGITQDELMFNDLGEHARAFVLRIVLMLDARTQRNMKAMLDAGGAMCSRVEFKGDGSVRYAFDVVTPDGHRMELWKVPT